MTPEFPGDPRLIWRNQPIGPMPMSADEVRARARRYGRRKRREAIVGIALGIVAVLAGLAVIAFVLEAAMPRLIVGAAVGLIGVAIRREASLRTVADATSTACLDFYRKGLELRRRQLSLSFDLWLFAAAFVSLLVVRLPGLPWYFYVLVGLCVGLLFAVRYRDARRAGRELEALDAMARAGN